MEEEGRSTIFGQTGNVLDHVVENVQQLYEDSEHLYKYVVANKADTIINELEQTIATLKSSWIGADAGVQINNVVGVYNALVKIRNVLAALSRDTSQIAAGYREIQNANRASFEELTPITIESERSTMPPYEDIRDTIRITAEAANAQRTLYSVNLTYNEFVDEVRKDYEAILNNWKAGFGRKEAEDAFNDFMNSANKYQTTLEEVSQSIADALKNYSM